MNPETLVSWLDPFSVFSAAFVFGCSHGILPDCDVDAKCLQWLNMPGCYRRNFGDLHTPEYLAAIRSGKNTGLPIRAKVSFHGKRR